MLDIGSLMLEIGSEIFFFPLCRRFQSRTKDLIKAPLKRTGEKKSNVRVFEEMGFFFLKGQAMAVRKKKT